MENYSSEFSLCSFYKSAQISSKACNGFMNGLFDFDYATLRTNGVEVKDGKG